MESEMKFRALVEATSAAIFVYQGKKNRYVNPAAEALTGYTQAELLRMNFWEVIHPDFRNLVRDQDLARQRGKPVADRYELKILTKHGRECWIDVSLDVIDLQGERAVLGTAFDITRQKSMEIENAQLYRTAPKALKEREKIENEHKQVERALRESEANLRAILDSSSQGYILIDRDHKIQAFNKRACWGLKLALNKRIRRGDSIYDFVPDKDASRVKEIFRSALAGESVIREEQHKIKGVNRWFEFNCRPVLANDGQVIGVCLGILDIDDRKKMADALAEREARLLEEMQSVLITTRALVSESEVKKLLEFIMTQAKHLTGANGAAIFVLSQDGQWFEVATADKSWLQMKTGLRLLVQGSLAELAIATKKVQISNRASDDARTASIRALLNSIEVNSLLCAPLIARGVSLGVLMIWNKRRQMFTDHDDWLMGLFADQAALAWRNTQLYSKNRELAIQQERHRLARELHDSVTQSLYSIGMAAQASLRLLPKEEQSPLQEPLEHIQQLSQIALTEIREQLYNLRPTALLEKGLIDVIDQHCDLLSRKYNLSIKFETDLDQTLATGQQEHLYYIVREALWNAIKYAQAGQVWVALLVEEDRISLSIVDDGIGFDTAAINQAGSMGLTNMKERARLLRGRFELQSETGRGTRIFVHTPMQPAESNED